MLVPGLHLTNGLPGGEGLLLFFPGLRRGACQEDVEASGPPAVPRRVADRHQQLLGGGALGCQGPAQSTPAGPPPRCPC